MQADKNQPLITDETNTNYPIIEEAPVTVGQIYVGQQQQQNNMYYGQNVYQGQPPYMGQNQVYIQPPRPPVVQQAIPIQIMNHPQIIFIQQQLLLGCPACGFMGSAPRRTAGCQIYAWCICLFIFTGFICCWIPFCIDSCYDIQIVCTRCGLVKSVIQS